MCKKPKKKYGHVQPKEAEKTKWKQVNVDSQGPATVNNKKLGKEIRMSCNENDQSHHLMV